MFSQFRQAVESLTPLPRTSLDGQPADTPRDSDLSRSNSLDSSPLSSSQLAESALSNLRKSLATQRSGSTGSLPKTSSSTTTREGRTKSRLEDRLRAATSAIADSSSRSPEVAQKPSSSLTPALSNHPLSETPPSELMTMADRVRATEDTVSVLVDQPPDSVSSVPESTKESLQTTYSEPTDKEILKEGSQSPQSTTFTQPDTIANPATPSDTQEAVLLKETLTLSDATEGLIPPKNANRELVQPPADNLLPETRESEIPAGEEILTPIEVGGTSTVEGSSPSDAHPILNEIEAATNPTSVTERTVVAGGGPHIEELQEKLRLVEQRFADVSVSFKRLQEEKQAADIVLRDYTPLETMHDTLALRNYFSNLTAKTEAFQDQINHLNGKLESQGDRLEELKDTHRLESSSQSLQIEKLRTQLAETDALLHAAHNADTQHTEVAARHKAEMDEMQRELERTKLLAKEEEEKRVKAISLLKTVRQKLVKAEKEKEDATSALALMQEKEKGEREKEHAERLKLRSELDASNLDKEKALASLKTQFDKEIASSRDRYDREISTSKMQHEAELASIQAAHSQGLSTKDDQIRTLQQSLSLVTTDKNTFFDDLQLRQAELESSRSHIESLESQNTEYQYQLRELNDRYALLKDDFAEVQRDQEAKAREPTTSSDEVARLLSATESKYELKLLDLKKNIMTIEKERNDSEADWSRKLRDKTREVEDLKLLASSVAQAKEQHDDVVKGMKSTISAMEGECRLLQGQLQELRQSNASIRESEKSWRSQENDFNAKLVSLEQLLEEYKLRESQLRAGNKTLREELRKVQSSAALLERQRNPGVGYWTSRASESNPTTSQVSVNSPSPGAVSPVSSLDLSSGQNKVNDEEVNLEYLRNVILQFLEHKEMRPNLVKVLSIILHFTPQETRRLVAKV